MIIFYILVALWVIMLIWMYRPPEGYEDDRGFHYGKPKDKEKKKS